MVIINQNGQAISEYDLTKGELVPQYRVKDNATPIDNISKFAWDPEDFEECLMYLPLREKNIAPTEIDKLEARLTYLEMMTGYLEVN